MTRTKILLFFGTPMVLLLITLMLVLMFGTKGCFSSRDLFAEASDNLTVAQQKAEEGKASYNAYNRQRDGFITKNGGVLQDDQNPPALSEDELLLKAKEVAKKKEEVQSIADKLNSSTTKTTSTSNTNTSSGASRSSARASRSYRPAAPKPQIIIIKEGESSSSRQSVRESISTDTYKRSTSTQKLSSDANCVGCAGAESYSDEIRQRQLESKRNGYNNGSDVEDPLCLRLPADPKHPDEPRKLLRFKSLKEKQEFMETGRLKEGKNPDRD